MKDPRNTWLNGIILGLATPFIFYFIIKGVSYVLAEYVIERFSGFSLRLMCILALVSNIIPFQIILRQERLKTLQGIVFSTLILLFALIYYFRDYFYQ